MVTERTQSNLSKCKKRRLLGRGTFRHVYLGFNSKAANYGRSNLLEVSFRKRIYIRPSLLHHVQADGSSMASMHASYMDFNVMVDVTNQVSLDVKYAITHEWLFSPLIELGPRNGASQKRPLVFYHCGSCTTEICRFGKWEERL
ncbi:hypothetical protein Vadar_025405 [Vaccinium darrowii]|uniref:Uncharacterized protein n=1 Tax=Vaccinium darrowii TaxID=229202 RepID=A0ACB7Z747_9ERIC|nr:hypothetical protein Vadar_025405 [Vaccinium darrowii]